MDDIPVPYGIRRPFISSVSNPNMRNTIRAPHHAFLWNCVDEKCEIIDTFSGLTITRKILFFLSNLFRPEIVGESSMVSKAALFQQWRSLMNKIKSETTPTVYYDAKQLAVHYQTAKMEVKFT